MDRYYDALSRAAAHFGIEPEYTDTRGFTHTPSRDALEAILCDLGVPLNLPSRDPQPIEAYLDAEVLASWAQPLDPSVVVREDSSHIDLRIPESLAGESIKLEIQWEGGDLQHHWFSVQDLQTAERFEGGGQVFLRKRLPLPAAKRLGYHRLAVHSIAGAKPVLSAGCHFIVCPLSAKPWTERVAGVAVSLYGLRSNRNWGCGDFTDLTELVQRLAPAGVQFIALNPLHALANRLPFNVSPYLPQSAFFRNFIYIDVERAPGCRSEDIPAQQLAALRNSGFVDYEGVARLKEQALAAAFSCFLQSGGDSRFEAFCAEGGEILDRYALYCVLDEHLRRAYPGIWLWTEWPAEYQDPASPAVAHFREQHDTRVQYFKFLQWQIDCQTAQAQAAALAAGMKIGLYHDLALAVDRFGADLWGHRDFFVNGCRVGAPPDEFAPQGQDWGFPPPSREAHRRNGYRLFAESIRRTARDGGALRIDHVMRFYRLYWIPGHLPSTNGAYVRDFLDDLLGVLSLESVRHNFLVVGEDLGIVPDAIRKGLHDASVFGYRLLWFERSSDGAFLPPSEYPIGAVASTTTHDLPTLAGFWSGADIDARFKCNLIGEEQRDWQWAARRKDLERLEAGLKAAGFEGDPLGFVLSTPSLLAVINQEDLTGEAYQQNLPASTWQYPNWQRKMRIPIEDLDQLLPRLKELIQSSGR